jgi:ribosomal protein L6P/L9E
MSNFQNKLQLVKYKDFLLIKNNKENISYFKKITSRSNVLNLKNSFNLVDSVRTEVSEKLKLYRKKLFLKGLGYKVLVENNVLSFKLNLSHDLRLEIPSYINRVLVNKTNIVFESYDLVLLGNFIEKIYNFKPKDNYKGKGFSLKSKVVPIKEIKKK